MPTLLQINTVVNSGSTGRIAENIGRYVLAYGWESYIAFGRNPRPSASRLIRIGTPLDVLFHVLVTRLFDLHGLASRRATKKLIQQIKRINPDVIHLHNIHGYYLNYKILFTYLAESKTPVVWTMHDCWAVTGHCPHYTFVQCIVWTSKDGCRKCPQRNSYPKSLLFSAAAYNFKCKKKYFNLLDKNQLTIVCPSKWLADELGKSYLAQYRRLVVHNGIDLGVFQPSRNFSYSDSQIVNTKFTILGVANAWSKRKGLGDFIELSYMISSDEQIVLIGVEKDQVKQLPPNIIALERTENIHELVNFYSMADVYFNASVEESLGMTCIEAQACGTPVIAYDSTAIPETFCNRTGFLVPPNDIHAVYGAIKEIRGKGKSFYAPYCREFVKEKFTEDERIRELCSLYVPLSNSH